ncbi:MAG: zinc-ribbon domain-containing protein [candidate division WOR-3 bacterium]
MVVACPKCESKYEVAESDVPPGGGAVRCPNCSNIFMIYREVLNIRLVPFKAGIERSVGISKTVEPGISEAKEILKKTLEVERVASRVETPIVGDQEKLMKHKKAERLGKSLAKDIYLYHKDKVERGRREGNLVELLGEEIKKSWEFYKKQVDPEVLKERNYFKEALNEIIGGGKEIFK